MKSSVVLVKLVKVLTVADTSDKMKQAEKNCIIRTVKRGQAVSLDLYQACSYIRGQTQHAWDFFLPYHCITLGQRTYRFKEYHQNYRLQSSYTKNTCRILHGMCVY